MESEKCEACKGEGRIPKIDIMKGTSGFEVCQICKGRGVKYKLPTDGIQFGRMIGENFAFRMLKDGKELSRLDICIHPIMTKAGVPLAKPNPKAIHKRDKLIPRLYATIRGVSEGREKIRELFDAAVMDPRVEWIEMSLYEAKCFGFDEELKSFGLYVEGTKLIKELYHDEKEEAGPEKPGVDTGRDNGNDGSEQNTVQNQ